MKKLHISFVEIALFLLPASQMYEANVVGRLFGIDIAVLILLPFILATDRKIWGDRYLISFIFFVTLWFLSAVSTDIYRGIPFEDFARGWSKILIFTASFVVVYSITKEKLRRLIALYAGAAFFSIVSASLFPSDATVADPWKFGYGWGVTALGLLICATPWMQNVIGRIGALCAAFGLALLSLFFDFRIMFAITAFAVATAGVLGQQRLISMRPSRRAVRTALYGMIAAASVFGITQIYSMSASAGLLGRVAEEKYFQQKDNDIGLLFSSRTEALASTKAIADSPIIGHGSWAKDADYVMALADLLQSKGVPFYLSDSDLIPTHSHILGAWVEAGIAGALFWTFILILVGRAIWAMANLPNRATVFFAFSLFLFCWDLFFSPFGAERRFFTALPICLAIWLIRQREFALAQKAEIR